MKKLAVLPLLAGLWLSAEPGVAASAESGPRLLLSGVVTAVAEADTDKLVTIDRGVADDDPSDDAQVLVTLETKVVPPHGNLDVGVRVKAVVADAAEGEVHTALQLVLPGPPPGRGENKPVPRAPVKACGTLQSFPDEGIAGKWVVSVTDLGDAEFEATGTTKLTPPRSQPEAGMEVCIRGHDVDGVLIADHIQLAVDDGAGNSPAPARKVQIRGTIGTLPDDLSPPWTLELHVTPLGTATEVVITTSTRIQGEPRTGATAVVIAQAKVTTTGTVLEAHSLVVLAGNASGKEPPRVVSLRGTVESVSEAGVWSLATARGSVEFRVTASSRVIGLAAGDSAVGLEAKVNARAGASGELEALIVKLHH